MRNKNGFLVLLLLAVLTLAPQGAQARSDAAACSLYYTVRRGDTLSVIAGRYKLSVATLQQMNGIGNPDRISVGQRLCVKRGGETGGVVIDPTDVRNVTAMTDVRVRSGPGASYDVIGQMRAGDIARVTGISRDRGWWRIYCTNTASNVCYVSADRSLTRPTGSDGSGAERIRFAPGAYSDSRSGIVQGQERKEYVLWAAAGQTMEIQLSSKGEMNFTLVGVQDGEIYKRMDVGEPSWLGKLPRSQDYRIIVGAPTDGEWGYTLYVAIR